MDTILLSFVDKNGALRHALSSGKVVSFDGTEVPSMRAEITGGISGGGEIGYNIDVFENNVRVLSTSV